MIEGQKIRQCTCDEQEECTEEIKMQGLDCVDECWPKLNSVRLGKFFVLFDQLDCGPVMAFGRNMKRRDGTRAFAGFLGLY
jgi:hypothetical protein